jgi:uroporphyrinogen decarboxylase
MFAGAARGSAMHACDNRIRAMPTTFACDVRPDWEALRDCILRRGTPRRVHVIELFLDGEVQAALSSRFGLLDGLAPADPFFAEKRTVCLQRFLGYDYVRQGVEGLAMPLQRTLVADTPGALTRATGRAFVDESRGPITCWEDFERYPWPQVSQLSTRALEWYEKNLPDDMCVIGSGGFAHFAEYLTWLLGYETLCYALVDQRPLVKAIADRLLEINVALIQRLLQFPRVKIIWGSDDMGFRGGTLLHPADLREFVLPAHRRMAAMAHAAGRPYLLHSCGNLAQIMDDLIADVRIDAKHSFEDTIEDVRDAKRRYGQRIAVLGGIDVDFLCRASAADVRQRVRDTLATCLPGGGYCLGTGNSVANYLPLNNYLAMLDEGRRYAG